MNTSPINSPKDMKGNFTGLSDISSTPNLQQVKFVHIRKTDIATTRHFEIVYALISVVKLDQEATDIGKTIFKLVRDTIA